MIRSLALASLVLLLCACSQKEPPAAPAPPPPVAQEVPPPPPAEASAQSETEQATHSQESADGAADAEHTTASDSSLEKITATPAAALPPGKWQSGVNYNLLVPAQPTSVAPGKVEVTEVFWLACPHCYALEPFLKSWLKSKPGYVEFVRVPVMWQPMHKAHAKLYYTLEALGRDDLASKAFEAAASRHELMVGGSDEETFKLQQQFATSNGVSADDFAKAFNSFSVNSNLQRATEVTQRYQVQGVPFVIVNGKYTTDVAMAGGEAKLIELINDLTAAEHHH